MPVARCFYGTEAKPLRNWNCGIRSLSVPFSGSGSASCAPRRNGTGNPTPRLDPSSLPVALDFHVGSPPLVSAYCRTPREPYRFQCVGQFASRLLGPRSFNKSPAFSNGNPTDLDGALSLPVACFSRERCTRWLRCIGAEFLTSGPTMCAASLLNLLGTLSLTMRATIASRPSCRRK